MVDQYTTRRQAVVDAQGRLDVDPEREPLLAVSQRGAGPRQFPSEAPLGTVRREGERLDFSGYRIGLDQIDEARLVFGSESTEEGFVRWAEEDIGCRQELVLKLPERDESSESPRIALTARKAFNRRHYFGVQLGGTGVIQWAYRVRAVDRLHVDLGFFGLNGFFDGSAGLLYDVWLGSRTALYFGAGGGAAGGVGEGDPCEEGTECTDSTILTFGYLRAGFAVRTGAHHRDVLGFDVGLWRGTKTESGPSVEYRSNFTWPMAGFSYHYAL